MQTNKNDQNAQDKQKQQGGPGPNKAAHQDHGKPGQHEPNKGGQPDRGNQPDR
jgi:hypothetical protein